MKVPKINWIPFDKNNPPADLNPYPERYLILFREDNYDNGATWVYHVDFADAYGSYLDNFWDTENDWDEGQLIEVVSYAEFPHYLKESDLVDTVAQSFISQCFNHQCSSRAIDKYLRTESEIKYITGYDFKQLKTLFARGYTLEPPKYGDISLSELAEM